MSDKKIMLSTIYACLCVVILIIAGFISGVGIFTLVVRSFFFGIISFFIIFCAQLFLKKNIISDDAFGNGEEGSHVKGSAVNVVVDDSYDADRGNSHDSGNEKKPAPTDSNSTDGIKKVEYNMSRKVDDALFDKTVGEDRSNKEDDSFVDLSHEIERSKKEAGGNPEEFSNGLRKWIQDAQPKKV